MYILQGLELATAARTIRNARKTPRAERVILMDSTVCVTPASLRLTIRPNASKVRYYRSSGRSGSVGRGSGSGSGSTVSRY